MSGLRKAMDGLPLHDSFQSLHASIREGIQEAFEKRDRTRPMRILVGEFHGDRECVFAEQAVFLGLPAEMKVKLLLEHSQEAHEDEHLTSIADDLQIEIQNRQHGVASDGGDTFERAVERYQHRFPSRIDR